MTSIPTTIMRGVILGALALHVTPFKGVIGESRGRFEERFTRQLEGVDARLRESQWGNAEKQLSLLLEEAVAEVVDGPDAPRLFGLVFTLRAVAAAGEGDRGAAEYWWWAAQGIWPEAHAFDLTRFGDVGLAVRDLGAPTRAESPQDGAILLASGERAPPGLAPPRAKAQPATRLPSGAFHEARRKHEPLVVTVTCVIDEQGRITRPWLPAGDVPPAALAAVLDALSQWTYEPARLDGHPQAVFLDVKSSYGRFGQLPGK